MIPTGSRGSDSSRGAWVVFRWTYELLEPFEPFEPFEPPFKD
jgi:hypothetical protein